MPHSSVESLRRLTRHLGASTKAYVAPAVAGLRASSSCILLGTRQIEIQERRGRWRGEQYGAVEQFSCPAAAPEEPVWRSAMAVLAERAGNAPLADIVLSNELVRYAVIPWVMGLTDDAAQQAYVQHTFAQTQNLAAEHWSLRYCEQHWAAPYLATAVEAALLEALPAVLATRAIATRSIQPLFAWAYNRWLTRLEGSSYWFVSAEPRRLVIGRVANGIWESVHSQRVARHWTQELPMLMTRARLQSVSAASGGLVYVATPGLAGELLIGDWSATGLRLALPGVAAGAAPSVAVAG